MPSVSARSRTLLALIVALLVGCAHDIQSDEKQGIAHEPDSAAPMEPAESYAEQAMLVQLRKSEPVEKPGLHNLFVLSRNLVSGSEPQGEAAFSELEQMGIKTVLSVDGMPPELELAQRHGMRYVHVPIQYSGIKKREILAIAKTFTELEGPFYVHCFHGRHRGPAAAAIGRLVHDGVTREQALAEMRQWCGTATKYEGLYRTIARAPMPSTAELEAFDYEFPSVAPIEGLVPAMSKLARAHDNLRDLAKRDFEADPDHPDVDAMNEAKKLLSFLEVTRKACEDDHPAQFLTWTDESIELASGLVGQIERLRGGDRDAIAPARETFESIRSRCADCHKAYRNN